MINYIYVLEIDQKIDFAILYKSCSFKGVGTGKGDREGLVLIDI